MAIWPPLPIAIIQETGVPTKIDNIILALEHNDRVCELHLLGVTNSELEQVLAAMQQPFPALTKLSICREVRRRDGEMEDESPPVVPESFLGGSAPRLQRLALDRIPFPGLPKLILSTTHLVDLQLRKIPHSGYISPEAMVRCLSTSTRLENVSLGFESPLSRPVRVSRRRHPPSRSAFPALTYLWFEGVSEYLEDLVARIDVPLLNRLRIRFFHQLIFHTPQLTQLIHTNFQPPVEVCIELSDHYVEVQSPRIFPCVVLGISCRPSDWQLSSLTQVCSSFFPEAFIPTVERLHIYELSYARPRWQDDIEHNQWLAVLHPFTSVNYLNLSWDFPPRIVPALQELVAEVLPSLQNLFLNDFHSSGPAGAIEKFVAARQLAGRPIAVFHLDRSEYKPAVFPLDRTEYNPSDLWY